MAKTTTDPISPVYVIGGFLGAGKTTLLKRLLAHELDRGRRPGVLMNEFGTHDVDSQLIHDHPRSGDLELDTLLDGCVCCTLASELPERLGSLLDRAPGQSIFVETTGLASTDSVALGVQEALASGEPRRRGRLASVVVVVDLPRFESLDSRWRAASSHLRAASLVILNKVDEAAPDQVRQAERRVRSVNPSAQVLRSSFANVPLEAVLESKRRPSCEAATVADSTAGFRTIACRPRGPIDEEMLRSLLARFRVSLVRLKGVVRVVGRRGLHEVQWVPGRLELSPFDGPQQRSQIVVIGRRLAWERFFDGLCDCVVPSRSQSQNDSPSRRFGGERSATGAQRSGRNA